jgi:hypothetical protein
VFVQRGSAVLGFELGSDQRPLDRGEDEVAGRIDDRRQGRRHQLPGLLVGPHQRLQARAIEDLSGRGRSNSAKEIADLRADGTPM